MRKLSKVKRIFGLILPLRKRLSVARQQKRQARIERRKPVQE